jgi:hypothetical protein
MKRKSSAGDATSADGNLRAACIAPSDVEAVRQVAKANGWSDEMVDALVAIQPTVDAPPPPAKPAKKYAASSSERIGLFEVFAAKADAERGSRSLLRALLRYGATKPVPKGLPGLSGDAFQERCHAMGISL